MYSLPNRMITTCLQQQVQYISAQLYTLKSILFVLRFQREQFIITPSPPLFKLVCLYFYQENMYLRIKSFLILHLFNHNLPSVSEVQISLADWSNGISARSRLETTPRQLCTARYLILTATLIQNKLNLRFKKLKKRVGVISVFIINMRIHESKYKN